MPSGREVREGAGASAEALEQKEKKLVSLEKREGGTGRGRPDGAGPAD